MWCGAGSAATPSSPAPKPTCADTCDTSTADDAPVLRRVKGAGLRDEDLAPFAVADSLVAKMTLRATWHLTEAEIDLLLGRARDELARAKDCGRDEAAAAMEQAFEAGHSAVQAGPEFAIVAMYGRVLIVMGRHTLRGICHPRTQLAAGIGYHSH
jgi:hypothetical protein